MRGYDWARGSSSPLPPYQPSSPPPTLPREEVEMVAATISVGRGGSSSTSTPRSVTRVGTAGPDASLGGVDAVAPPSSLPPVTHDVAAAPSDAVQQGRTPEEGICASEEEFGGGSSPPRPPPVDGQCYRPSSPNLRALVVPPVEAARGGSSSTHPLPTPAAPTHPKKNVGCLPSRRNNRHGVVSDGAAATDEDSMANAMRRKAASNFDF
jgi:hypothetical protein